LRRCIKGPCGYDPVSGSALGDPVTPASLSSSSSFSSLHSTTSGASILGNSLTPNKASRSNDGEETSASAPHTAGLGRAVPVDPSQVDPGLTAPGDSA